MQADRSDAPLTIGIDLGTQSVRVVLLEEDGTMAASGAAPLSSSRSDGVRQRRRWFSRGIRTGDRSVNHGHNGNRFNPGEPVATGRNVSYYLSRREMWKPPRLQSSSGKMVRWPVMETQCWGRSCPELRARTGVIRRSH